MYLSEKYGGWHTAHGTIKLTSNWFVVNLVGRLVA